MWKTKLALWFKKKETRGIRLVIAGASVLLIISAIIITLSALLPRVIITVGGRLSFKTPDGFTVGSMYSFPEPVSNNSEPAAAAQDDYPPRSGLKDISFAYPELINIGKPSYYEDALVQNVNFKLKSPNSDGFIQIWKLSGTLSDLLNRTIENSSMTYKSFKTSRSETGGLKCTSWNYTFEYGGRVIHGLEAFVDDSPYLYRISLFIPEKNYKPDALKTFDELVGSVRAK